VYRCIGLSHVPSKSKERNPSAPQFLRPTIRIMLMPFDLDTLTHDQLAVANLLVTNYCCMNIPQAFR